MERFYPENAVIAAPLSGYTDLPFRRALRRAGCFFAFTEMVDVSSIACNNPGCQTLLLRGPEEPWLGVQLVGSNLEHLKIAVDTVNERDFDVLDFNLGCPVPKVARKHAGAALGRDVEHALECFGVIAARSRFPVTAKIRILDESDPAPTIALVRGLAELGARAVTIHGRVMASFYSGPVRGEIIAACREAVKVQVVANGGIMSGEDCRNLRRDTGCDAVMVARGMMGNPWLFREIADGEKFVPPALTEWAELMRFQVEEMTALYGESAGMCMARKIVLDYLRGRGFGGAVKNRAARLRTLAEFRAFAAELETNGPAPSYWDNMPRARRLTRLASVR